MKGNDRHQNKHLIVKQGGGGMLEKNCGFDQSKK